MTPDIIAALEKADRFLSLIWPNLPLHLRRNMAADRDDISRTIGRLRAALSTSPAGQEVDPDICQGCGEYYHDCRCCDGDMDPTSSVEPAGNGREVLEAALDVLGRWEAITAADKSAASRLRKALSSPPAGNGREV